jgi:hypothetical protein
MEFELTWVDLSLVVCRPTGTADVKGYEEVLRALASNPDFGAHVSILMDLRELDVSSLKAADMEELVSLRVRLAGESTARAAMVVGSNSPLRYGLGRMFEGFITSQVKFEVSVFEEYDEAIAWLRSGSPPAPELSTEDTTEPADREG